MRLNQPLIFSFPGSNEQFRNPTITLDVCASLIRMTPGQQRPRYTRASHASLRQYPGTRGDMLQRWPWADGFGKETSCKMGPEPKL